MRVYPVVSANGEDELRLVGPGFDLATVSGSVFVRGQYGQWRRFDVLQPFVFRQQQPSSVWTIAHNLGYKPSVSVVSDGGSEILAEVVHLSDNVLRVLFSSPASGWARLI